MSGEVQVVVRGALLEGRGPGEVTLSIHDAIQGTIQLGEQHIRESLHTGHGLDTGEYQRSIHGTQQDSANGRISDTNAIIGKWLEIGSTHTENTRFRGYGIWRKGKAYVRRLLKAKAEDGVTKLVVRLNK